MSKIKELKNKETNNVNIIDVLSRLVKSDKTKYIGLFECLLRNRLNINNRVEHVIERLSGLHYGFNCDDMSVYEVLFLEQLVGETDPENIDVFNKFCDYNERKLIENNDITTYKTFDQLSKEVSKVDIKLISKDLEKQVITLFNSDEWVVVKPLTYESSKKYGANTKWCTTSVSNPEYFYRYFRNGNLIYILNKKTGYKVAAYKSITEREVSFWDQKDSRIDSFDSELPGDIINLLRNEFKECKKSNFAFANQEDLEKEMKLNNVVYRDNRRRVRVNNEFDGEDAPHPEDVLTQEDRIVEDAFAAVGTAQIDENIFDDIFGDDLRDPFELEEHRGPVEIETDDMYTDENNNNELQRG